MIFRSFLLFIVLAMPISLLAEPVNILLLTYNHPAEHDVLESLLCGDPRFNIVRDEAPGTPNALISRYSGESFNFISMTGHHSSGFFGHFGDEFNLENLNIRQPMEAWNRLFSSPKTVKLNGCNTTVIDDFGENPIQYLQENIDKLETKEAIRVIRQSSGLQKAYRQLFPNACIMGYSGTSTPGGIAEIYMQYSNYFRALYEITHGEKIPAKLKLSGDSSLRAQRTSRIGRECPGMKWPCNLCEVDPDYYGALVDGFYKFHSEQQNISAGKLETKLTQYRAYRETQWNCSGEKNKNAILPSLQQPLQRGKVFFQLLLDHSGNFELAEEFTHQLAQMRFSKTEANDLKRDILPVRENLSEKGHKLAAIHQNFTQQGHSKLATSLFKFYRKIGLTEFIPSFGENQTSPFKNIFPFLFVPLAQQNLAKSLDTTHSSKHFFSEGLEKGSSRVFSILVEKSVDFSPKDLEEITSSITDRKLSDFSEAMAVATLAQLRLEGRAKKDALRQLERYKRRHPGRRIEALLDQLVSD